MTSTPGPGSSVPRGPLRTLVSAQELQALRAAGVDVVVLDCGFDLADPAAGERAFAQAHLPGAVYAHLDRDLSGVKTGRNGRHPLPAREAFAERVGAWGIGRTTQVVAYDAQGGPYAARAWWMLRWLGHEAVAVLDGGPAAWRAAGGEFQSGPAAPTARPRFPVDSAACGARARAGPPRRCARRRAVPRRCRTARPRGRPHPRRHQPLLQGQPGR
jgi:thiosulfate/3-mercaptopyruvate sulfurtransferase